MLLQFYRVIRCPWCASEAWLDDYESFEEMDCISRGRYREKDLYRLRGASNLSQRVGLINEI